MTLPPLGCDIDVSLLDTAVSMLSYFAIWALNRDWQPERIADSGHQTLVPAQNFPTGDGWIVVFCNKDKFWRDLVEVLITAQMDEAIRVVVFTGTGKAFVSGTDISQFSGFTRDQDALEYEARMDAWLTALPTPVGRAPGPEEEIPAACSGSRGRAELP